MDYDTASDAELVHGFRRGDVAAFDELFRRYQGSVYRYLLGLLGNPALADEASQNTFLGVFLQLRRGRAQICFRPWLFRIARNKAVDLLRRRRARPALPFEEWLENEKAEGSGAVATPEDRLLANERAGWVVCALESLEERHRTALVLRDMEGLAYGECASVMQVSESAFRSLLFRARACFRRKYTALAEGRQLGSPGESR